MSSLAKMHWREAESTVREAPDLETLAVHELDAVENLDGKTLERVLDAVSTRAPELVAAGASADDVEGALAGVADLAQSRLRAALEGGQVAAASEGPSSATAKDAVPPPSAKGETRGERRTTQGAPIIGRMVRVRMADGSIRVCGSGQLRPQREG